MNERIKPTSVRFTLDTLALIRALGVKLGISQTAVLSLAVRRLAEIEKIELPSTQKQSADQQT